MKDEPFTTQPSIGVSKYLKVQDGKLIEALNLSQITNREWTWVSTLMSDGSMMLPKKPDAFRITFQDDNSFTGTTDCNSFFGQITLDNNKLSFGPIGSTKMFCEGSQESEFLKSLADVEGFLINVQENQLVLLIKYDSGTITFK
jgi:heat shock protein HslJ